MSCKSSSLLWYIKEMPYLSVLSIALLKDLLNDIVIDGGAKLVLKSGLGSCIECSLNSLSGRMLALISCIWIVPLREATHPCVKKILKEEMK
jgi:hypothetical protein